VLLRCSEVLPRTIERDSFTPSKIRQRAPLIVVARLCPWIDCTIAERAVRVADNQRLVVLENGAESVAALACAAGIVERKKLRRRRRRASAVVCAFEPLSESKLLESVSENDHAFTVAVGERSSNRIVEARADII
jgi:hypothetical protein